MSKARDKAIIFLTCRSSKTTFEPVKHKMLRAIRKHDGWGQHEHVAPKQGPLSDERFDLMERGDPVILCFHRRAMVMGKPDMKWDEWVPAICISVGKNRKFKAINRDIVWMELAIKEGLYGEIWRIPYSWQAAVLELKEASYDSKEEVEAAMEAATKSK
jgi:hypothetical protein